jgi:hypothetical protein
MVKQMSGCDALLQPQEQVSQVSTGIDMQWVRHSEK